MGERAALTRLRRECSHIQAEKIPHIVARPTEKNLLVWHYVLHDLSAESPYVGGVYWGKLVFPKEYPLKPPAIYMLTPSGRFETNVRLCLSMSDFHPESWNPSWRIESILIGLVSFMLDTNEPRTTGGMQTTPARRRELARASFEYNRGQREFQELFPEFCDESRRHPSGAFFFDEPSEAALRAIEKTSPAAPEAGVRGTTPTHHAAQGRPGVGAPQRRDPRNHRGMPAALLALSVLVFVVSCVGLLATRGRVSAGGGR
eukprot:TRINITY_DN6669_c0_g1_i1.p1 TRINITY_DN6669_c0_g1~~TRINITY_DN6669_c0_g1_i1.p1  ORF type:complete len:291 (+),score=45.18 TRINITY_DN6669_c0_g1_i1:99-875(+)